MDFYCKQYFDLLDEQDQDWIDKTVIHLLSHCSREIGGYRQLNDCLGQQKKYAEINLKLCALMEKNKATHHPHKIDWQISDHCFKFNGMLDIIIQSLKTIKLIEVIQNENKFKSLATQNYALKKFSDKKCYLIKTSPDNYNISQRVITLHAKPALLIDNLSADAFRILHKLSHKNNVFVAFNPYAIEVENLGIQLGKDYGINFTKNKIINTLLARSNTKTQFSHKNTQLQFFIKKTGGSIELSLELIDVDNLQSSTIFIHAKFNEDLSQCTHFDKAIILYDTLSELKDIKNTLDAHKDNRKVKLYQIDGQFDFKDFLDLVYWGNDAFTCVIAECFLIKMPDEAINFYACQ